MSDKKAVIKNADMSDEMQQDAVDCAMQAMEKYNIEKDIAAYVKKEFDKKYNPTWHCIVGRNFVTTDGLKMPGLLLITNKSCDVQRAVEVCMCFNIPGHACKDSRRRRCASVNSLGCLAL
uniref:Dynein light chain n=1 Tax=Fundulus heteroclitus TaxID=8078 RepID=A0A3Q2PQ50_FUNHE